MNNFIPHPYQQDCINAVIERPGVALWLEMGLGKTVVTLTAIATLLQLGEVSKVLIVAPKKVAEATWQDEIKKWEHLQWLRTSTVLGTAQQRERALLKRADIYITNRDSVVWLATRYGRRWPFDMVVLDEASSFKHHSTQRFKALRKVRPFIHRVVELTGTPAPKDYMDLWAQVYLLDQGQRLGQRFTQYRDNYFQPDKRNGMQVYSWRPRKGAEEVIQAKLADIAISIQAADHLHLPDKIIEDAIEASRRLKREYKKPLYKFGVETVQFQYYFAEIMRQKSAEIGEYLPIEEINSVQNKDARIQSLQPFVKNGYLKFSKRHKALLDQMLKYPMGKNDDGPDALQMAVSLALSVKVGQHTDYKSVLGRAIKFRRGAY